MAEISDAVIDAALARGAATRRSEPRAVGARYDLHSQCFVVELSNGCSFSFPSRLVQGLEGASEDQLSMVQVLGTGSGLHWEALDVDLSVPGLLSGLFGTAGYMARRAGQVSSPAKAAAARANGAKGGRPRVRTSG